MMILELQSRGHEVHFIDHKSLVISPNKTSAFSNKLTVNLNEKKPFFLSEMEEQKLKNFDVLLMRQDPPFDIDYIYNTYILDANRCLSDKQKNFLYDNKYNFEILGSG